MSRTIKSTDKRAVKSARKAEKNTRRIRQALSRANGR